MLPVIPFPIVTVCLRHCQIMTHIQKSELSFTYSTAMTRLTVTDVVISSNTHTHTKTFSCYSMYSTSILCNNPNISIIHNNKIFRYGSSFPIILKLKHFMESDNVFCEKRVLLCITTVKMYTPFTWQRLSKHRVYCANGSMAMCRYVFSLVIM